MSRSRLILLFIGLLSAPLALAAQPPEGPKPAAPFAIHVVDAQTGRGVPLVELRTVSNVAFVTDSAGCAAIDDPALLGRRAFFTVSSHGYEFPKDGFGMRGAAMELPPGGSAVLKINRLNIAERLYRVTGEGIYRDTVIVGGKPPIEQPLLNAEVVGQDSVQRAIYHGNIYWFWGDTNRQAYPLGHFGMAGATSDLPGSGGLPPDAGVNLRYFQSPDGFSRPTFGREGNCPIWMDGLFVLKDANGVERMTAAAGVMESLGKCVARRLVEFDDATNRFRTLKELPVDFPVRPTGATFTADRDGVTYLYFTRQLPDLRVIANLAAARDPDRYEAFTCLAEGERSIGPKTRIARDGAGKVSWAWRPRTNPPDAADLEKLVKLGKLTRDDAWFRPRAAGTNEPLDLQGDSVAWNAYRKKWVMIAVQRDGKASFLGEIWYAEADAPEGPWASAVKVVTHDRYSFYNPVHHPFFDQEGGRYIYFEGTYANTFSGNPVATPRYDYNQVMYKLDLGDERLRAK
jgi:hypothetical protein